MAVDQAFSLYIWIFLNSVEFSLLNLHPGMTCLPHCSVKGGMQHTDLAWLNLYTCVGADC